MTIFLENKYTATYYRIVDRALSENRSRKSTAYYEDHHIIPEHFFINRSKSGKPGWLDGDPEAPDNHVLLTFREHRTCHLLLRKMLPEEANRGGIAFAALLMSSRKDETGDLVPISSKLYDQIKKEAADANRNRDTTSWSGENHWSKKDPVRFRELLAGDAHWMNRDPDAKQRFLDNHPNTDGRNARLAYERGNHVWLANNPSVQRSKDGTHQMFRREDGSSIGGDANIKRIAEGTHNWLGGEANQKRIDAGTHNFLGSDSNNKRLAEGTHPSQVLVSCIKTRKVYSWSMFKRWVLNREEKQKKLDLPLDLFEK